MFIVEHFILNLCYIYKSFNPNCLSKKKLITFMMYFYVKLYESIIYNFIKHFFKMFQLFKTKFSEIFFVVAKNKHNDEHWDNVTNVTIIFVSNNVHVAK